MNRRFILRAGIALIGIAIGVVVGIFGYCLPGRLGYCLNITPSEPVGIYRLVPGGIARGALVVLKQPDDSAVLRRYAPAHLPLIKRVAAIAGDMVEVGARGVYVNGNRWPESAPLTHDQEGRSLRPYPFGVYRVAEGMLWVMSNHSRGLDSRYFGPVPAGSVISRLAPLVTWSSPLLAQMLALAYPLCVVVLGMVAGATTINSLSARVIEPRELRQQ